MNFYSTLLMSSTIIKYNLFSATYQLRIAQTKILCSSMHRCRGHRFTITLCAPVFSELLWIKKKKKTRLNTIYICACAHGVKKWYWKTCEPTKITEWTRKITRVLRTKTKRLVDILNCRSNRFSSRASPH